MDVFLNLLLSVIRLCTPIFVAGLGNMFCERVGVLNLGAEGMMISGAFMAVLGSYMTGNAWCGVLCGILGGIAAGGIHALVCVEFGGLHAISGLGLTMFCRGVTKFLCVAIFGSTYSPYVSALQTTDILAKLPMAGSYLAQLSPLVYAAILLGIGAHYIVFHTTYGLRMRALGDDPRAVETAGIDVWKMRYSGVLICGALCGLAGAYMGLGQLDRYFDGMISGKGMIAVIAVKMGNWSPLGIFLTALLLGLFDVIQLKLQISKTLALSPEMLAMIPYLAGIAVLCMKRKQGSRPTALDTVYLRNRYKL
ncbi:MAG: ABC transporter permease [Oscillibacter sp.]|nr:ABC transporter permease [Oscillibacter sp.]